MGPGPLGCSIHWLSVIKGIYLEDAPLKVCQVLSVPVMSKGKKIKNKTNFIQVLHYS